jgi:phosphatidate cytidylyltransferase
MLLRTLVGVSAFAVVVAIAWVGGWPFALLAMIAMLMGGSEFYSMLIMGGFYPQVWLGMVWLAALAFAGWQPHLLPLSLVLYIGFVAVFIWSLTVRDQPVTAVMATVLPALYMGIMGAQAIALRELPNGLWWLLLGFLVAWGNDTFAYFAGTTLGKHKIWPRVSPKKTWEGTIAGWLGAAVVSVLVAWFTPLDFNLGLAALLGFAGGILGFFGDLTISMVKRQVGVKDSGRFFPGHGGMLDRLDSMLFVLPFVYQAALLLT